MQRGTLPYLDDVCISLHKCWTPIHRGRHKQIKGIIEDVINKLKEVPEIVDVYKVQGIYDIIARVNSDTEEKLKEFVSKRIRRIDRITGTVTVIIAK